MGKELRLTMPARGAQARRVMGNGRGERLGRERVFLGKCLPGVEAGRVYFRIGDFTYDPFSWLVAMEIPAEASEAVPQDLDRSWRTPDVNWGIGAVVVVPEECVKSAHVIHVEMGEKEMFDRLNARCPELTETTLTTIEKKTFPRLSCINRDKESVVRSRLSEDLPFDRHGRF